MNTPNKLTLLRIILCPFLVFFLMFTSAPHRFLIALIIFLIASITDHLDGKIARAQGIVTDFGKFADPLADKILVMSALLCFIDLGIIGAVPVIIMIIREFMVTSVRLVAVQSNKVIAANKWGKAKTVSQIATIALILILQYINELIAMDIIPSTFFGADFYQVSLLIGEIGVWISAILTIISGGIYIFDNRKFINTTK